MWWLLAGVATARSCGKSVEVLAFVRIRVHENAHNLAKTICYIFTFIQRDHTSTNIRLWQAQANRVVVQPVMPVSATS